VSFTFGCPAAAVVAGLQQAGAEVWVTVTNVAEAALAVAAGADALVVQGAEAGGHRASFVDDPDTDPVDGLSLLSLLQLVLPTVSVPVVASGGIATGSALAAALCAGAAAAQLGTAFLRSPEAGTSAVHRHAVEGETPTVMTRVFTGRLARGVKNRFIDEHAPGVAAYPEVHYATAALRQHGREFEDPDVVNLWVGQTHTLARDRPAAEIVRALDDDCRRALAEAAQRILR
jgi:nitronate monooxygenase